MKLQSRVETHNQRDQGPDKPLQFDRSPQTLFCPYPFYETQTSPVRTRWATVYRGNRDLHECVDDPGFARCWLTTVKELLR